MLRTLWVAAFLVAAAVVAPVIAGEGPGNADVAEILRLHEKALAAHRANDIDMLLADAVDDYVMAGRGEISFPTRDERAKMMGPYFQQTEFTRYEDLVAPVVRVSGDGTLGWLICQVRMEGTRTMTTGEKLPVDSTWAWIELYEKRDGAWKRIGNLSNMKPVQ